MGKKRKVGSGKINAKKRQNHAAPPSSPIKLENGGQTASSGPGFQDTSKEVHQEINPIQESCSGEDTPDSRQLTVSKNKKGTKKKSSSSCSRDSVAWEVEHDEELRQAYLSKNSSPNNNKKANNTINLSSTIANQHHANWNNYLSSIRTANELLSSTSASSTPMKSERKNQDKKASGKKTKTSNPDGIIVKRYNTRSSVAKKLTDPSVSSSSSSEEGHQVHRVNYILDEVNRRIIQNTIIEEDKKSQQSSFS